MLSWGNRKWLKRGEIIRRGDAIFVAPKRWNIIIVETIDWISIRTCLTKMNITWISKLDGLQRLEQGGGFNKYTCVVIEYIDSELLLKPKSACSMWHIGKVYLQQRDRMGGGGVFVSDFITRVIALNLVYTVLRYRFNHNVTKRIFQRFWYHIYRFSHQVIRFCTVWCLKCTPFESFFADTFANRSGQLVMND